MFTATEWWDNSALHGVMELNDKTRPHIFYAHGKVATVLISMFIYTHVLTMLFFSMVQYPKFPITLN